MRRIKILEFKTVQSENFDCYVKYEDRLFWFKPIIIEAFRHKFSIYTQSDPYTHKWHYKETGHETSYCMAAYLCQQLENNQATDKRKMIQAEIQSINI